MCVLVTLSQNKVTGEKNLLFSRATARFDPTNVDEVVGWFKTMVTNEYIKGVKNNIYSPFNKKLLQRFFEHIIRNEQELYDIRKYIEENPIKWETDDYYIN